MDKSTQKNIWDREQVKRISGSYSSNKRRLDTIANTLCKQYGSNRSTKRLLNIGIGNGYLESILLKAGFDVYFLDPSENAVTALLEKLGLTANKGTSSSVDGMPYDSDFFDGVIMSEVLEHLDDHTLSKGLEEVQRILKPSGMFLGTVPDNEDLNLNSFTCPHCGNRSHRVGHVHSFVPQTLNRLLSQTFHVEICRRFRGMHLNLSGWLYHQWVDLPFKLARLIKGDVRAPHQIEFNIFFVCKQK